jgi:hypothetical protein
MEATTSSKLGPQNSHWLGEPIIHHQGTYDQVADAIPLFGRRPFALYTKPAGREEVPFVTGENPYFDEVLRLSHSGEQEVPIGIVSKSYKLIQHRELFEITVKALDEADVPLSLVMVSLTFSKFGGRMALRFVLPERFSFDPGDSHPLHLRLECFNSVDGSTRLVFMMSWYRLVCSNGLVARVTGAHEAMIHTERAELPDIKALISAGVASLSTERKLYGVAMNVRINHIELQAWIDGELKKKWGALAAARTYLICESGFDGVFLDPFDKQPPSQKTMKRTQQVPGAPARADNAYAVSQALAWIARQRLDVQEQTQYMKEIPHLMQSLAPTAYPRIES